MDISVLTVNNRNWLAPVTLTSKDPLTEVIIYGSLCDAHFFKLLSDSFLSFLNSQTCELLGIYELIALSKIALFFKSSLGNIEVTCFFIAVDYLEHIDIVSNSVLKVTLIVARNSHNCTCTIACKYKITNEHTNFPAVYRVDAGNAFKLTAGLCFVQLGTIHIILFLSLVDISLYLFPVLYSVEKALSDSTIRSEYHKCDTVDSLDTSCEDRELSSADDLKLYLNTCRLANPVSLDSLCRLRPVDLVESFKQFFCKSRLVDYPLLHILTNNRETAALRLSINDLVVGKNSTKLLTPVNRHIYVLCIAILIKL